MPILNVKPQSIDLGSCKPPQRIDVGLRDHHQTWLANYNEIRTEVNKATCDAAPRTLVYRNHLGHIGANSVYMNELVLGSSNPNNPGVSPPIIMNANEFKVTPRVTTTIQGPAFFANTTTFLPGSKTYFEGPITANTTANFKDRVNFYGYTHFHPSSILKVEGISYFDEEMFINDNVDMTGDLTLVGDIAQTGNTVIDGNLDVGDDLIVRGNLSVLGDHSTFEVSDLRVEDKNIIVNHGAVSAATDAGIWFQHFVDTKAGYMTVDDWSTDYLTFKAPTAFEMKVDIPIQDVSFRLEADFAADQELLTTSDVIHRSLLLDKSYTRHFDVPSYTQQHDPIAKDKGWLSTPWVYTNAVESNDNLTDANTTGLYMGTTSFTVRDEIALYSHGEHKMFLNQFGDIGFGTKFPTADLHLFKEDPTFRISTVDYTSKATLSFTDFSERIDTGSMYLEFDSSTGDGLLELTTQSPLNQFAISVGGYLKQPEMTITNSTITIHDDVEIYGNEYVSNELVVDNTLFVRSHLVGINRISPDEALDVSGNIKGDSDLILNGLEPFVLIGPSITSLENMGRSGVAIEEQSPLVQMTVTEPNYRHGSILYFNDSTHDKHWVMGTVNNGSAIDLGKAHGSTINTPEYGLDEYHGETLMRMDETDRVSWYLESTNSNPAMRLNTRNNGVHLYLGEQNDLFALTTDTTSYTDNDFSSSVQWHGNTTSETIGELTYFPNGNDDGDFGSFRFSRTDGTVNQGVPSAKVGANQFYANDKIGISQTTPTAELHITKDYAESLIETEDRDTYVKVSVDDTTSEAIVHGEHTSGSSYFKMKATNPATLELVSDTYSIEQSADHTSGELILDLSETITPASYIVKSNTTDTGHYIERPGMKLALSLMDNAGAPQVYEKRNSKTTDSVFEQTITDTTIYEEYHVDLQKKVLDLKDTFTAHELLSAGSNYIQNYIDSSALYANTSISISNFSSITFEIDGQDVRWISTNPLNTYEIHNRQADGKLDVKFSGDRYKLVHTNPTDVSIYCAYRNKFVIKLPTTFESPVYFNDKVVANSSVEIEGSLTVEGPSQFNDSVNVEGPLTANGDSVFNSKLISNDEFISEGTAEFNEDVTFNDEVIYSSTSNTTFDGPITFNEEVHYSETSNTTFDGPSYFNEDVTITENATFTSHSSNTSFSNTVNFYSNTYFEGDTILEGDTYIGGGGISSNDDPDFKLAWKKEISNASGVSDAICFSGFNASVFSVMGDVDIYIYDKDFSSSPFGVSYLNLKIAGYKISGQTLNMTLQETQTAIGDDYASAYTKVQGNCIKLYPAVKASDPTQDAGAYDYKVIFRGVIKNGDLS